VLAVVCSGSAIRPGPPAVVSGGPAIFRRRPTAGASDLRLILGERVPDRGADVTAGGIAIARLGGAVAFVRPAISLVAVVALNHVPSLYRPGFVNASS
jgi:hypothetical protein